MYGSTAPNPSHANIPRTGRERSKRPVSRPSRPALRVGVTGGEPPLLSSTKIERLDYSPIPVCIALPGGRKEAPAEGPKPPTATTGPQGRDTAFHRPDGAGTLPAPQEGRKRPETAQHGGNGGRAAPRMRNGPRHGSHGLLKRGGFRLLLKLEFFVGETLRRGNSQMLQPPGENF